VIIKHEIIIASACNNYFMLLVWRLSDLAFVKYMVRLLILITQIKQK